MLEWLQKYNHMARLGTFHTMAFIIPVNLEKFNWWLIAEPSLMADQSIKDF